MMQRAMFYLNPVKPDVYDTAIACAKLCREREIESIFFESDREVLQRLAPELVEGSRFLLHPEKETTDVLFVFGGDGTMLHALDAYVDYDIPILGINLGRLGFLLETQTSELAQALDLLIAGTYEIEHRLMLSVRAHCSGMDTHLYATNEISIARGLCQRMIALDAFVGDTLVDHYIADGLVLASPTGSTAYSLSAGGPIVSPDVSCFVLNPICPHSLQSRPIVLSCNEQVTLRVNMKEAREGIQFSVDGQNVCQMDNLNEVTVSRSEHDALLIRFPKERNFFSLLRNKLSQWSL